MTKETHIPKGSMAHDRMITDWMDALHDYPLDEIK